MPPAVNTVIKQGHAITAVIAIRKRRNATVEIASRENAGVMTIAEVIAAILSANANRIISVSRKFVSRQLI